MAINNLRKEYNGIVLHLVDSPVDIPQRDLPLTLQVLYVK